MQINNPLNVALIGLGYWGKNILRNLVSNELTAQVFVCDINQNRIREADAMYKLSGSYNTIDETLKNKNINAVIIATPTVSHFETAKKALLAGKHVLVEKPVTTSAANVRELIAIAASMKLILMVDHVFLYNPTVMKMKEYVSDKEKFGSINYIDSTRVNLGIYRPDINVLWDLACHDISIINYLVDEKPNSVRAIGRVNPAHGLEDITYLFLNYPSGMLVQINSSWASPVKIRKMIIGGEKEMIIYDDIEPTNKLVIYDYEQNIAIDENKTKLADYRLGNITIPKYEPREALKNVIHEFYNSIISGKPPLADGNNALDVVTILEKAQESLRLNGATISL